MLWLSIWSSKNHNHDLGIQPCAWKNFLCEVFQATPIFPSRNHRVVAANSLYAFAFRSLPPSYRPRNSKSCFPSLVFLNAANDHITTATATLVYLWMTQLIVLAQRLRSMIENKGFAVWRCCFHVVCHLRQQLRFFTSIITFGAIYYSLTFQPSASLFYN